METSFTGEITESSVETFTPDTSFKRRIIDYSALGLYLMIEAGKGTAMLANRYKKQLGYTTALVGFVIGTIVISGYDTQRTTDDSVHLKPVVPEKIYHKDHFYYHNLLKDPLDRFYPY